jgi:hypothetical protein
MEHVMNKKTKPEKDRKDRKDKELDKALEESFPGSDPISVAQPAPNSGAKT